MYALRKCCQKQISPFSETIYNPVLTFLSHFVKNHFLTVAGELARGEKPVHFKRFQIVEVHWIFLDGAAQLLHIITVNLFDRTRHLFVLSGSRTS